MKHLLAKQRVPPMTRHLVEKCSVVICSVALTLLAERVSMNTTEQIYKNAVKSVVSIASYEISPDAFSSSLKEIKTSTGTGFAYDKYIITNAHVVQDAIDIRINDQDSDVVKTDINHDLGLLQVKNKTFPKLKKCTTPVRIGQKVLAIGNPYGYDFSLTAGIISGTDRVLESDHILTHLIQTDAAVNPGNSGGPLLDAESGCVLGMNTAIVSPSGGNTGVGFAIPIEIIDQFIKDDGEMHMHLGISMLPDKYADLLGIHGVIIKDVFPDSIAERLGLTGTYRDEYDRPEIGDVIIGIDEKQVRTQGDLLDILETMKTDDIINLDVLTENGIQKRHT